MADLKTTQLTEDTSPTYDDLIATVHDPGGSPANRKVTFANAVKALGWVDARSYASINAAVTAIGATQTTLVVTNAQTLTANLIIPSTLKLVILNGGSIVKASTYTLTINGLFEADLYQVFSGLSAGDVTFGSGSIKEVYPEWWYFTDYAAAINAAIASIRPIGGTIKFTRSAELTSPINATDIDTGIVFEGNSPGAASGSQLGPMLTIKHTGVGFDLTASQGLVFRNLMIYGDQTIIPKVGFLLARKSTSAGAGYHIFDNVRSDYNSKFSIAVIYSYGSETNNYYNLNLENRYPGGKIFYSTSYNTIHPVTSTFQTIATGGQSNTCINFWGGLLINLGGTGSDIFYFDGLVDAHFWGVAGFNANVSLSQQGRAFFYVDTTHSGSSLISIDGLRSDANPIVNTDYLVYFGNEAPQTSNMWSITNSHAEAITNAIYAGDDQIIANLHYKNVVDQTGNGLSIKTLKYSMIYNQDSVLFTDRGGCVYYSDLWGWIASSFTLTNLIYCTLHDTQTGLFTVAQSSIRSQSSGGAAFQIYTILPQANRRNWDIAQEVLALGDFAIRESTAVGGTPSVYRLYIDRDGQIGMGGVTAPHSNLAVGGLPIFANNATALAGGLTAGDFYRTNGDPDLICVVH